MKGGFSVSGYALYITQYLILGFSSLLLHKNESLPSSTSLRISSPEIQVV